ncbi:hypothetical protein ACFFIY_02055 [Bhargavaea ullalensis]|uniref:Uncharacterized protein n=1 Tax=Bhargavaea ullalensis TaxID=1265685 RepID=A0ABV2GB86_9BACL|nr:hypothetical protein [Bhargavaea cecembensis]
MKATFKTPKSGKGWFGLLGLFVIVLLGGWPIIPLLNNDLIILGMPTLMAWSILLIILTTGLLILLNKMGVND